MEITSLEDDGLMDNFITGVSVNKIVHFIKFIFSPDTEEIKYYSQMQEIANHSYK